MGTSFSIIEDSYSRIISPGRCKNEVIIARGTLIITAKTIENSSPKYFIATTNRVKWWTQFNEECGSVPKS